jgi:3-methyladenine DNA glycosylase AlkD
MSRYGIPPVRAFGVTVGELKRYAKEVGVSHALAEALWASGWYEARLLAAFVGDASKVTVRQMDDWAKGFDNWAVVDTVCFALFDRAPGAWRMVRRWANAKPEFTRRAAFALVWSLTVHDKAAPDRAFLACLPLVERAATDDRHFVMKAVSMALRAIGKRNQVLRPAAIATAQRLAALDSASARAIGREAVRELTGRRAARPR